MSSASSTHHPGPNTWGGVSTSGSLSTSLSETLSQSKSHYQPGYMMSTSQSTTPPQGHQRTDEVPVVQTKAKINHVLSRGSTSDFGMDSMFESSRQRQNFIDEDAPPTNSINDIPNEIRVESPGRFQLRHATVSSSSNTPHRVQATSITQLPHILYIVVFGYPPDKYTITVEYFKSMGETTDADQNTEIVNCFRIGYKDPGDAMRAVRKNGEVLGGSWMVGAKWADPAQAEALLGRPLLRGMTSSTPLSDHNQVQHPNNVGEDISSPQTHANSTPTVGTPIRLASSASAFRKNRPTDKAPVFHAGAGLSQSTTSAAGEHSSNKGMFGQVSDLIFGW